MQPFLLYKTMISNLQGLHIEPTNICTLKCAGCSRTQFLKEYPKHWKNHSLDIDSLLTFLDIDLRDTLVLLCGNYGDPIYHPEFPKLVDSLKKRGCLLRITTNGSYRTKSWWQEATASLTEKDQIVFSIDGTPANFSQYRVNADWESIKTGISVCVDSPAPVTWKFIPFAFNEKSVEEARNLSHQLGIDNFLVDPSSRFDRPDTQHLKPTEITFVGSQEKSRILFKEGSGSDQISPKCYNQNQHYISAQGYYMPCCFVAEYRFYYKMFWAKDKNLYDIRNHTFSQIISRSEVIDFYQNINEKKWPVCQFSCGGQ
jgi:MoaA/NifB/PqqE/SkfB family radical SAM enzyme